MRQGPIAQGDLRDFTCTAIRLRRHQGPHRRAEDHRLVYEGKIQIDPMITHVMPLAEINNAFELMKRGESIRGAVAF
jgi:threonine dehydrogenase-like Zn-dependent dehydrogenase